MEVTQPPHDIEKSEPLTKELDSVKGKHTGGKSGRIAEVRLTKREIKILRAYVPQTKKREAIFQAAEPSLSYDENLNTALKEMNALRG